MKKINSYLKFIPMSENPLSAEVYFIHLDDKDYIYDVGSNDDSLNEIKKINNPIIIISHFHDDHMANLRRIEGDIYLSNYSYKRIGKGNIVDKILKLSPSVTIYPLNTSHSKGSLMLELNEEYLLVGDALYTGIIQGEKAYNVNMLKETIETLKLSKAKKIILSHDETIYSKDKILKELGNIYNKREKNKPFIFIERE
jgi:glyoxylase-like metal-dependent hydrolase (beta-lactamase superfamily II)